MTLLDASPLQRFGAGLTEAEVRRFQTILREDCGADVTLPEAWSRAIELLSLIELLLRASGVVNQSGELSASVRTSSLLTKSRF